jgi:hypothetical protein
MWQHTDQHGTRTVSKVVLPPVSPAAPQPLRFGPPTKVAVRCHAPCVPRVEKVGKMAHGLQQSRHRTVGSIGENPCDDFAVAGKR